MGDSGKGEKSVLGRYGHFEEANGSQGSLTSSMSQNSLQETFWQKEEFSNFSHCRALSLYQVKKKIQYLATFLKCVGKRKKKHPNKSPQRIILNFGYVSKSKDIKKYLISENLSY